MLDLTGERFGRLTVISRDYEKQRKTKYNPTFWSCKCDCGNYTTVATQSLRRGLTTSCGCYQKERSSKAEAKSKMKKCRYDKCLHDTADINTVIDDYHVESNRYYHADCWIAKQEEEKRKEEELKRQKEEAKEQKKKAKAEKAERDEKTKNDLKLIRTMWVEHINKTVVYGALGKILNDLLDRGIDSDYLVFTVQYCITYKLNLKNPGGLVYFIDRKEIKDAYAQRQRKKQAMSTTAFVQPQDEDNAPSFSLNTKPSGFGKILGGG